MTHVSERVSHLHAIGDLKQIVDVMRTMAARHVQQSAAVLPGLRSHAETLESAMSLVLGRIVTTPTGAMDAGATEPRLLVVLGVEHGFSGAHAGRVLDRAALELRDGRTRAVVAGSRTLAQATERRIPVLASTRLASNVRGALETADALLDTIDREFDADRAAVLDLVYARRGDDQRLVVETKRLVPVDASKLRASAREEPPIFQMEPLALFHALVRERLASQLMHAIVESVAAENTARLATMDAAHRKIDERLGVLEREVRTLRQDEITAELADLLAGLGAPRKPRRS